MLVAMMFRSFNPLLLISYAVQALLIVHCFKTGRNSMWIWVLLFLPGVGALAYLAVEILPQLGRSRGAQRAARGVRRALDPGQSLRRFEAEARRTGDVASNQRYADELVRQGRSNEAASVYRQALRGLYEHDPNLLLGLARAQFTGGDAPGARATLDTLIAHNPAFKSPEGHLLYARALEGEGNHAKALEEYQELSKYYAGAEATLRYAQLQARTGAKTAARTTLEHLLEHARLAPRHYQRAQAEWLELAKRELESL
jgi:hypothetical protein